jgi:hypothetical protein
MAMGIDQNPHRRHYRPIEYDRKRANFNPVLTLVVGIAIGYFGRGYIHSAINFFEKKETQVQEKIITEKKDEPKTIENVVTAEAPKEIEAKKAETTLQQTIVTEDKYLPKDMTVKKDITQIIAPAIDTTKPKKHDTLKAETKKETYDTSTDYKTMFSNLITKGIKPAIHDTAAASKSMMDETEKGFYKYMVEGISRNMRTGKCDSVQMYCDAIKGAFPQAHKNNRRIAMDINSPDREKSWAYIPIKSCKIKFEW